MTKLWKKFDHLTDECYSNMISANPDKTIWDKTFDTLLRAIEEERSKNPDFARELYEVDETTDYEYCVEDWLMDYLDQLGMCRLNEKRYEVCEKLLELFAWKEQAPEDIWFEMASALAEQGKVDEAVAFCEKWYKEEPEAELSAASLIYARISAKDYAGAEQLVEKYISKGDACTDENELIYRAAAKLYEEKGDKETAEQMKKSLEEYEEDFEREIMEEFEDLSFGGDFDDFDDDFDEEFLEIEDEELPFS